MNHSEQKVKQDYQVPSFFFRLFSAKKSYTEKDYKKVCLLIRKNFEYIQTLIPMARHRTESHRDHKSRTLQYKNISRQITLNLLICYTDDTCVRMSKNKNYLQTKKHPFPVRQYLEVMDAYIKGNLMSLAKRGYDWLIEGNPDRKAGAYQPSKTFIKHCNELWRDTMPTFTPTESYPEDWSCIYISDKNKVRHPFTKDELVKHIRDLSRNKKNKIPSIQKLLQYSSILPTYEVLDKLNKMIEDTFITFVFYGKGITNLTPTQIESVVELVREKRIISLFDLSDKMIHKIHHANFGIKFYSLKVREKEMVKIIKRRREIYEEEEVKILNVIREAFKERKKLKKLFEEEKKRRREREEKESVSQLGTESVSQLGTESVSQLGTESVSQLGTTIPFQHPSPPDVLCTSVNSVPSPVPHSTPTPPSPPLLRTSYAYLSEIITKYPCASLEEVGYGYAKERMMEIENLWRSCNCFIPIFYVRPTRLVRIFNETVLRNGRFYRSTVQSLPSKLRTYLRFNGKPVCECDFSTIHPSILYNIENVTPPENLYVYGKDEPVKRKEAKIALLVLINSENEKKALQAVSQDFRKKFGYRGGDPRLKHKYILEVFDAVKKHNSPISKYFCTGKGKELMRIDSDIALQVLGHFVNKGVMVIPVHDSFICPIEYKDEMVSVMKQTFKNVVGTLWDIPVEVSVADYLVNQDG